MKSHALWWFFLMLVTFRSYLVDLFQQDRVQRVQIRGDTGIIWLSKVRGEVNFLIELYIAYSEEKK